MPKTPSSVTEKPDFETRFPGRGPRAHEDLTIAEHLESMWREDKDHPGEECFHTEDGENHGIEKDQLNRFLHEYGALHPSDYLSRYGTDWKDDLFR